MTMSGRWIGLGLLAVVAGRVLAAIWAALSNIRGDYYASLPGAYVRTVNPTLWNSPDMQGAWGYHVETYFHGPVQYLTLYAMAYLDSYAAIAQALLPIYVVSLAFAFWCLFRALAPLAPDQRVGIPLLASTFLFFPLLQAFIQREFEVVVFTGLSAGLWALVRNRKNIAAALLAYVAWFKYVPLMFVAYLGLRGWYRAVWTFVATSAVILLLAHAVFGLELFVNNNVPGHAAQVFNLFQYGFEPGLHGYLYGTGFCYGWIEIETTLANVRHGLCSISFSRPWVPPHAVYLVLCTVIAVIYLVTHFRCGGSQATARDESWRRALEFSIVTTVYSTFFFNHYYYLIVLAIPLNVLLVRYLAAPASAGSSPGSPAGRRLRLLLWAFAYFCLSAFVIPTSVLGRISGADVWAAYIKGAWFLWGELLLMALLLREYWELGVAAQHQRSAAAAALPPTGVTRNPAALHTSIT